MGFGTAAARGGVLALVLFPLTASAQTQVCSYATADWVADLDAIDHAMERSDPKEAAVLFELMSPKWECVDEPLPTDQLVRYMHLRALMAFSAQDSESSLMWARAAEFAHPGAAWPRWLAAHHPLRDQLAREGAAEVMTVEDRYLLPPKKGGIWIDGKLAKTPTAPIETPVFVQVYDKDAARVTTAWQEGASFPTTLLATEPVEIVAPKWWVPAVVEPVATAAAAPGPAPTHASPPLPTTPMPSPVRTRLRNGGLIAASTGLALYGTSWALRGAYDAHPSDGLYYATNTTFVASITAGIAAGGLLVGAVAAPDR